MIRKKPAPHVMRVVNGFPKKIVVEKINLPQN